MKRVAVILVNYGDYALRFLQSCYESLLAQTFPKGQWSLFIVDNASTPESRAFLEQVAKEARILPVKGNLGWAGGNNSAIRIALREGYDYFVMLNMDVVLDGEWLKHFAEDAERRGDVEIFQSKIYLHGTDRINSFGNRIQFLGYGYCNGYGRKGPVPSTPIDFASGASMLVKREVFERCGLFCEEYFLYGEDLEFCWRARLAGYRVGLAERSICYHKYDFRNILNALYYVERNRLLSLFTLEKWGTLLLTLPALLLFEMGAFLTFTLRGKGGVFVQILHYFLQKRTWRFLRDRRRQIKRLRLSRIL